MYDGSGSSPVAATREDSISIFPLGVRSGVPLRYGGCGVGTLRRSGAALAQIIERDARALQHFAHQLLVRGAQLGKSRCVAAAMRRKICVASGSSPVRLGNAVRA